MKKILASIFGIAAALLVFVGCPTSPESAASLTLDKNALVITSALGGYTSQTLTATLENSTASLEWYTTNSNIVSVSATGSTATLICEGTQGTARVGAITSDGELEAYCTVSVVLSETPAQALTDVTLVEGSQTVSGFTLTWNYPAISSAAVIDVFEDSDSRDTANKLAENSSSEEPTVYKTYTVKRDVLSSSTSASYTISDLLSNAEGKTYYYSAYGFLNGKRSTSYTNGTATLIADSTAPGNVENIESTITDHAITLTWTEPADEDYSYVTVSISPATDFAGTALDTDVATQTLKKGTTTAKFENLAAETEHTFTFKTADSNGNVQGDTNNADLGSTATFSTAKDETAPAGVSALSANGGRTSVTLTWTDPTDVDLKEIHVYQGDSTTYTTVAKGTQTLQVSGLSELTEYTFTVKAVDYNSNESIASTTTVSTANPVATNVSATFDIDFETVKAKVSLTWNAPTAVEYDNSNNQVTYSYKVVVEKDGTEVESDTTETGTTTYTLTNELDFETEYTFTVKTVPSDDSTKEFTGDDSSLTKSFAALISIKNGWGGRVLVPFKTSKVDYVNCVIVQDDTSKTYNPSAMTYPYWIVRSALDDTSGFSLEAASSDGTASGLYLWFADSAPSGSTNYDVDGTGWGSGSSPHAFTATADTISTNTVRASFAVSNSHSSTTSNTGYSSWKTIKCDSKYWYSGNSNPYLNSSESTTNNDYAWCYKIID